MTITAVTLRGTPAYAAGKFGNAMSGGVLGVPSALTGQVPVSTGVISGTFTLEAWVKISTAPGGNKVAMGHDGVAWFGVNGSGQPLSIFGSGTSTTLQGSTSIADGLWHHMALTCAAGNPALYVDGARVAVGAASNYTRIASTYEGVGIGGMGTSSTSDWPGSVDEAAISLGTAQYTGTSYTLPVTAFQSTRPGQVNLYHLEADGTDSDAADVNAPTIGAISVTPSGGTDTITYPAPVAGTNAVSGVSLYEGTTTGGESGTPVATNNSTAAGTFTRPTASTGQKFYYVRAFDISANYSAPSNEVASPPPTVIPPTAAGYLFSPYNWDITSARALCNTGGYMRTLLIGNPANVIFNFDVSNIPATAANRSQIEYRIDSQVWTAIVPTATVTVSIPAATSAWTSHLVELRVKSTSEAEDRWASPYVTAVKFTGLTAPGAGSLVRPDSAKLTGLFYGDSITEGTSTLNNAGDATNRGNSRLSWCTVVGELIGAEVGVVGFGRQGLGIVGNGSVPVLGTTWNLVANGLSRDFTTVPDFVAINIGTNDQRNGITVAAFKTAYTSFLNALIAQFPITTKIIVFRPFGGYYAAADYQSAIAATSKPSRVSYVETSGWWNSADSSDTLHPFGYINKSTLGPKAAEAIRGILNKGLDYVNVGGVAVPVTTQRR